MKDLKANPVTDASLERCVYSKDSSVPVAGRPRVGILVTATGDYVRFLDGFMTSGQQHLFPDCEVHFYIFTDPNRTQYVPDFFLNVHVLDSPMMGWPLDSMLRHHFYLKNMGQLLDMDYLFVQDADTYFLRPVGRESLGERVGVMQSFHFAKAAAEAPFEIQVGVTSSMKVGEGQCYYAGGAFGGSPGEMSYLLMNTTWMMEYDMIYADAESAHDDEGHLNRFFLDYPPSNSLPGNYIYPEPPADNAWGMTGRGWKHAFPPRTLNLGARKYLEPASILQRQRPSELTVKDLVIHPNPSGKRVTVVVHYCKPEDVDEDIPLMASVRELVQSVNSWHHQFADVLVIDSVSENKIELEGANYFHAPGAPCGIDEALLRRASVSTEYVFVVLPGSMLTWQLDLPLLFETIESPENKVEALVLCPLTEMGSQNHPAKECLQKFGSAGHWRCQMCAVHRQQTEDRPVLSKKRPLRNNHCLPANLSEDHRGFGALFTTMEKMSTLSLQRGQNGLESVLAGLHRSGDAIASCQQNAQPLLVARVHRPQPKPPIEDPSIEDPSLGLLVSQSCCNVSLPVVACWGYMPSLDLAYGVVGNNFVPFMDKHKQVTNVIPVSKKGYMQQECLAGPCVFFVQRPSLDLWERSDVCSGLSSENATPQTVQMHAKLNPAIKAFLADRAVQCGTDCCSCPGHDQLSSQL